MSQGIGLSLAEVHESFSTEALCATFRPILSPVRCAEMLRVTVNTMYFWLEKGDLSGTHRRRGKHQFIWRDRAVLLALNGKLEQKFTARLRATEPGIGLTSPEISAAFANRQVSAQFGPILGPNEMAELLGLSRSTIYFWIEQGHFAGAVTKRGKRQMFWRDRAITAIFNGVDWKNEND